MRAAFISFKNDASAPPHFSVHLFPVTGAHGMMVVFMFDLLMWLLCRMFSGLSTALAVAQCRP